MSRTEIWLSGASPAVASSAEARALLAALIPPDVRPRGLLASHVGQPGFRSEVLGALAARHGAAGFLVRAMASEGIPVPDSLRLQARAIRVRNLQLAAALEELMERLESAGIRALSIKGPAVSSLLHGDAGLRPSNDLDVLVAPVEVSAAERELIALGYCPDGSEPAPAGHHVRFTRGGVVVELHRRLFSDAASQAPFDELWRNRRVARPGSIPICVPGGQDLVKHLAVHGARHGFVCLKWLADLAAIVCETPGPDWDDLVAGVQGTVDELAFLQGFHHLAESLGIELPHPLQQAVRRSGPGLKRARRIQRTWFADRAGEYVVIGHRLSLLPWTLRLRRTLAMLFTPGPADWALLPRLRHRTPWIFPIVRPVRLGWIVGYSTYRYHLAKRSAP